MRYRKLTDDGDMVFGTGSDYHIRTAEGVAQAVATRLRLYKGEWRYDKRAGVQDHRYLHSAFIFPCAFPGSFNSGIFPVILFHKSFFTLE